MATQVKMLHERPAVQPSVRSVLSVPPVPRQHVPPRLVPRTASSRSRYPAWVALADVAVIVAATLAGYTLRFGSGSSDVGARRVLLVLVPATWLGCLVLYRTYEMRFLGVGGEEFVRVLRASTLCGASVGAISWAFKLEIARGFIIIALPGATVLTLATRYLLRRWLSAQRQAGAHTQRVLLVGPRPAVEVVVRRMQRAPQHGMSVVGLCVPGGLSRGGPSTVAGIPILGGVQDIAMLAAGDGYDGVAVLPTPELDGGAVRRLGWALEESGTDLYVAPAVTETVGHRLTIRPVAGLSLLHVEHPELTGVRRIAKGAVDRLGAGLFLVFLAPVLLTMALLVRIDSRGPALFRQARVGRDGRFFTMLKFRTMVADAEHRLVDLRDDHDGNAVLFKMKDDPRVTRVGKLLRRWSLDELPQLINVLLGHMSLVGPRPPLAAEVALYGEDARRRLLVKPGITGLWQISGRSDLDWDESVRLDLHYVENWSFISDVGILCSTVGAVLGRRGAY